jgi:hypothetical protein
MKEITQMGSNKPVKSWSDHIKGVLAVIAGILTCAALQDDISRIEMFNFLFNPSASQLVTAAESRKQEAEAVKALPRLGPPPTMKSPWTAVSSRPIATGGQ